MPGDEEPFLPYFLMLAMEALNCLLKKDNIRGFLYNYRVRGSDGEKVQFSHLLFFDKTYWSWMTYLIWLLIWLKVFLSLKNEFGRAT